MNGMEDGEFLLRKNGYGNKDVAPEALEIRLTKEVYPHGSKDVT